MPTITYEQITTLLDITKSLTEKYRLDKPVDYSKELKQLMNLLKELQTDPQYKNAYPSEDRPV
jgi:hypothetical protein